MPTQPFHFLAFALLNRRVIPNEIPCHEGCLGTASLSGALAHLALLLCDNLGLHLLAKPAQPESHHGLGLPRRLAEKPAHSPEPRTIGHLPQQPREGPHLLTKQ